MTSFNKLALIVFFSCTSVVRGEDFLVPAVVASIPEAISLAENGDRVLVEPGAYFETGLISLEGKSIAIVSTHGPELTELIWSGTPGGFLFANGEGPDSRLEGLTLRNGGVLIQSSAPTIFGNHILGGSGTGLQSSGTPTDPLGPRIIANLISGWVTPNRGAGMRLASRAVVTKNRIVDNTTNGDELSNGSGGAIYVSPPSSDLVTICDNLIAGNSAIGAFGRGGGLHLVRGEIYVRGNTFASNVAAFGASAIFSESSATIENCIVWDHPMTLTTPAVAFATPGDVSYCLIEGGFPGVGNIDEDPQFVSGPLGEYYLSPMSPCVDSGSPLTTTFDGTTQADDTPDSGIVDMGYHRPFAPRFIRGDCNADGAVDVGDAIFQLAGLFVPASQPIRCEAACDSNRDVTYDLSDAVFLLSALFVGGTVIPNPFPDCGSDPVAATLGSTCWTFPACP